MTKKKLEPSFSPEQISKQMKKDGHYLSLKQLEKSFKKLVKLGLIEKTT